MKNNRKYRKVSQHVKPKKLILSRDTSGFASSQSFVSAVTRIYSQEIKDIDRFVKFAELHSAKKK